MMLEHPILAIDHGAARIGTAISDPVGIMAHPLETIPNNEQTLERIKQIIQERHVKSILIGLPLHMNGTEGKASLKIRHFKNTLKNALLHPLPIELIDESLTTVQAAKKLHEAGRNAKQQKSIIDQAAAVEILNAYLQSQNNPFGLLENPDEYSS